MLNLSGTTVVILDTSCLGRLRDVAVWEAVRRSSRAADQIVLPTAVNLLEVLKTQSASRRRLLLGIIDRLRQDRPVLTWPQQLLRHVAEAIAHGEPHVTVSPGPYDALLDQAHTLSRADLDAGAEWLDDLEVDFDETHRKGRREIRKFLRERPNVTWENASEFLNEVWSRPALLDDYIRAIWVDSFGLPSNRLDVELVMANDSWRLFLDGWGVAVFERAVLDQQPRRVGTTDLAQLTYLGISNRRILVTADRGLLRAARAVLCGRYENARALHIDELVSAAT